MSYFVAAATYAQYTPLNQHLSTLVLVELSLVVVLGVVVLVDVVTGKVLGVITRTSERTYSGSKLVDWSQTRLAGMDLAKSSIDLNSSSERSTAVDKYGTRTW
jgi:hypothetical protein